MLDKSVEFKHVIMRVDGCKYFPDVENGLPSGFAFRFFADRSRSEGNSPEDDAKHWARIETSVIEFDSEPAAAEYFAKRYLPHIHELRRRCIFALNTAGVPIATATAWYAVSELGEQAALHWVAVCPEYQGRGIGRAIVKKALNVFHDLDRGKPVWLHTQTWSHPAIRLYHSLGFNMVRAGSLANNNTRDGNTKIYQNDFDEALRVLREVMGEEYVEKLKNAAASASGPCPCG